MPVLDPRTKRRATVSAADVRVAKAIRETEKAIDELAKAKYDIQDLNKARDLLREVRNRISGTMKALGG